MGFWSEVGKFLGDVLTNIQVSQLYPTLQAAMYKSVSNTTCSDAIRLLLPS